MDEPNWLLRSVTYHFASGQAWWVGLILLLLALRCQSGGWSSGKIRLLTGLGLTWVALSGWPEVVPQVGLMVAVLAWLIRPTLPAHVCLPSTKILRNVVMGIIVLAILLELRWFCGLWRDGSRPIRELAVIGDSVTAGLNDRDVTWPRVLAQSNTCTIWDASQQGATLESAVQQLARLDGRGDTLLIEIGGNDLLEGLPVELFRNRLFTLLLEAKTRYHTIVMLELPLPPLSNQYGNAQRRLASLFGVPLIPKREFARVLTASGATVDGIHLSDRGQERLAQLMRDWLNLPGQSAPRCDYHRVDVR